MPRPLSDVERRDCSADRADITLRAVGAVPTFIGHAAVVNSRTSIGDPLKWGFYEEMAPGAFDDTVKASDIRFLVDHDTSLLVSRKSAGDLRVTLDAGAPLFDSDLDQDVSYIRDLTRNVEKRRITGMSIGFMVREDDWSTIDVSTVDDKGQPFTTQADLRTIKRVELMEGSAVTFPAYEETDAALRALRSSPDAVARREALLRRAPRVRNLDRSEIGRAIDLMAELRAGKVLSAANVTLLQNVLDTLAAADVIFDPLVNVLCTVDGALDTAQADLSNLLGVDNPDANDPDEGDASRAAEPGPAPAEDYVRALAARHGLRL